MKLKEGEIYYYKDNAYEVVSFGRMKLENGSWVDSVNYRKSETGEIFSRERKQFEMRFIPSELSVGDTLIATSMGRILGTFKVVEINENSQEATAYKSVIAEGDDKDSVTIYLDKKIFLNGSVLYRRGGIYKNFSENVEFYFVNDDIRYMLKVKEALNNGSVILMKLLKLVENRDKPYREIDVQDLEKMNQTFTNQFGRLRKILGADGK